MNQSYDINEFIADCSDAKKVHVAYKALETAAQDFGIESEQKKILEFISNGGLEKLNFINSEIWDANPNPAIPAMVDAYGFYSGFKFGYMAFLKNPLPKTKKWLLKSFKKNKTTGPASFPFKVLEKIKEKLEE